MLNKHWLITIKCECGYDHVFTRDCTVHDNTYGFAVCPRCDKYNRYKNNQGILVTKA